MMQDIRSAKVGQLEADGVLFVEDGNHGEYRPLRHEFAPIGIPFVRPPDLVGGRVVFQQCDRINAVARQRVRKGVGKGGDILFTHRATVGRMALVPFDAPEFVANPGVTVWRCLDESRLDRQYLYFWMQTRNFMDQVWAVANSSDTFPYIGLLQQRELTIEWPEIDQQRAIGRVLGALDNKIELNRQMNETLEAMAQAIFRDWFVDFGPTRRKLAGMTDPIETMGGLVQDPARAAKLAALFPAALGDNGLPQGWEERPLGEVTSELRRGLSPSYIDEGGVRVLNQKCIRNRQVSFGPSRRHDPNKRSIVGRELQSGDVLVNSTGVGTLGRIAQLWEVAEPLIADSHITVVRADLNKVSTVYLGLNLTDRESEVEALGEGSTGQTELSRTRLGMLAILVPAHSIQMEFDQILKPFIDRMSAARRESQFLAATRDLLLPKLMSGEIRLRDAEAMAEAGK